MVVPRGRPQNARAARKQRERALGYKKEPTLDFFTRKLCLRWGEGWGTRKSKSRLLRADIQRAERGCGELVGKWVGAQLAGA